jgi:hypothetical protein
MTSMHALPLLAAFVDPYEIFFRQAFMPPRTASRFGDEPNLEARWFRATARHASEQRLR